MRILLRPDLLSTSRNTLLYNSIRTMATKAPATVADAMTEKDKTKVCVCGGRACLSAGAQRIFEIMKKEAGVANESLKKGGSHEEITVSLTPNCLGDCYSAPIIQNGEGNSTTGPMNEQSAKAAIQELQEKLTQAKMSHGAIPGIEPQSKDKSHGAEKPFQVVCDPYFYAF